MKPENEHPPVPHEERHHMTYSSLDPLEYVGLVKAINDGTQERYSQLLQDIPLPNDACIITVGSDGKHERHAQSQSEFVLIITNPDNGEIRDKAMKTILQHQDELHPDLRPYGSIEVKVIHSPMPCSYTYNEISRIYPDRYLNSNLIVGNEQTYLQIREKVLSEIADPSDLGRRIREKMKDQLRDYQKTIDSGIFRGITNFDPEHAIQWYNEPAPTQLGFKSAYIRSVQRKFDIVIAQKIKSEQLEIPDTARSLPSATIDKFDFFAQREFLSTDVAEKTAEAYAWFLQQYHHIQEHYKNTHQSTTLQSNQSDFTQYSQIIKSFLKTTL
jgi:hypothetical protein